MKLYLQIVLGLTATLLTQMALVSGLSCNSNCAACWKDNSPGEDTKFVCDNGNCGDNCPFGFNSIHCADFDRCK